ncbi:hypothetical protein HPB48_007362 [Haemaphysalis longicornis]|uniref:Cuticle protein n=1 Tax=Haemaphysalis longicornis TaxID=44386 RepID=A0A9J6G4W8_HAELO|nr:hypothetical protein HPB48_007362 [Haemaphysalis longicornis]
MQPPQPYSFSFDNTDEFGTRITQQESGDENNNKVGSYSYTDPDGITRTAKYTADADGFHVTIETNEPGTKTSNPADAQIVSSAAEAAPAPKPVEVKVEAPKPVVVQAAAPAPVAVQATPVTIHAVHAAPFTQLAAPVSYATAQHVTPLTFTVHTAPLSAAKSA